MVPKIYDTRLNPKFRTRPVGATAAEPLEADVQLTKSASSDISNNVAYIGLRMKVSSFETRVNGTELPFEIEGR